MASRPDKEALALSALGEFAKSFIAAKQQRRAESRDDERFARELAAKRLEDEQARRYQQFKAEMDAQQALLGVTRAGAKKALYDASGKLTGYEESGIDPATVAAGQQEVEAILGRYRGVSNAPSIMPGIEGTPVAVDKGISRPSVFPGLDVPPAEAQLEVNPAPLPKEATTPMTGLRPASSVKTTVTSGDGPDAKNPEEAKKRVSTLVDVLRQTYDQLNQNKALVTTKGTPSENISAATRASAAGQFVGKISGTENQRLRDQANTTIPLLVQAIRQATAMGARGMDTQKELEFYLQAASSPKLLYEANKKALDVLEAVFGEDTPDNRKKLFQIETEFNSMPGVAEDEDVVAAFERDPKTGKLIRVK